LDNVRLLCQKGANVNASSSAGLIDSDGNVGPSRVTPLMDACENGNTGIARLLLRFNANVDLLNEHGDTAMDLLRKYMDRRKRDMPEKDKEDCQKVLDLMEKKAVKSKFYWALNDTLIIF
jgi:hypothetical protein